MTLQLPIESYFRYHPPTTPERIALHDRVNRESLEICKDLIAIAPIRRASKDIVAIYDRGLNLIAEVCQDELVEAWATSSLVDAKEMAQRSNLASDVRANSILMYIQQFRMFLNQGITVDELKHQPFIDRTSALISKIEKHPDSKIHLILDGDKWCALIGENLQVGIAGFGDDPIAALSDLYVNVQKLANRGKFESFISFWQIALASRADGLGGVDLSIANSQGNPLPDEIGGVL